MQEGKDIRVGHAIADGNLLVAKNGVTQVGPILFGLGAVQPERVPALSKELAREVVPVEIPRLRIRGVVDLRIGDVVVLGVQLLEVLGGWIEKSPHGDHGVHVHVVQLLHIAGDVMVVGVEDGIAFLLPPEPVLHDSVHRDMLPAIPAGDIQQLLRRDVLVLRLEETVSPEGQQRGVSGQIAVLMNHLVHFRTGDEVVIDRIAGVRDERELQRKAIVGEAECSRTPHQGIALGGDQKGNCNIGVVLAQLDGVATVVQLAALMLAQPVEALGRVWSEAILHLVGAVTVRLHGLVGAGQS